MHEGIIALLFMTEVSLLSCILVYINSRFSNGSFSWRNFWPEKASVIGNDKKYSSRICQWTNIQGIMLFQYDLYS